MKNEILWKVTAIILLVLAAIAIAVLSALLAVYVERDKNTAEPRGSCESLPSEVKVSEPAAPPLFHDLTKDEVSSVKHFLLSQRDLDLRITNNASYKSINEIMSMELLRPNKQEALRHLDSGDTMPKRWARVLVLIRNSTSPSYLELKVGPMPKPSQYSIIKYHGKERSVSYQYGPVLAFEAKNMHQFLTSNLESIAKDLLVKSFNATFTNCEPKCLDWYITPVPTYAYKAKRRLIWARVTYKIPIFTVHPLDFYVLMDVSSTDPSNYSVPSVYYNKQIFSSLHELVQAYNTGKLKLLNQPFPNIDKNYYSVVHLRGSTYPKLNKRPPVQYEPDGIRYSVKNQQVTYMLWTFNFRMSPNSGMQLFDIRYNNKRIAYEISLQELGVFYSGRAPVSWFADFVDSVLLLGSSAKSLVPGIDCPANARFLPARFPIWPDLDTFRQNVYCLFEHDNGIPLRRHNEYKNYHEYTGLTDYTLILRTIMTTGNYDYILDFIFHADGVMEIRLSSTGYIIAEAYSKGGELYGFRLNDKIIGSLHHHVFNFKVDIDVNGIKNRFETIDLEIVNVTNSHWTDKGSTLYYQAKMKQSLKKTELEAAYKYNFDAPKYLIFHNKDYRTKHGNPRAYRLINKGVSKNLIPEDKGNEGTMSWARYQVAVTKFKEDEPESSSLYNMFAVADPVVKFQDMIDDNDSIIDEDLVAWVSMGLHHIPHSEDLPQTTTTLATVSTLLQPYNFFDEDPSVGSKDSIRIEGDNQHVVRYMSVSNKGCHPTQTHLNDFAASNISLD